MHKLYLTLFVTLIACTTPEWSRVPSSTSKLACYELFYQMAFVDELREAIKQEKILRSIREWETTRWQLRFNGSSKDDITYRVMSLFDQPLMENERISFSFRWKKIVEDFKKTKRTPDGIDRLARVRMNGSDSITGKIIGLDANVAMENWIATEQLIGKWISAKEAVSLDNIKQINRELVRDIEAGSGVGGVFRGKGQELVDSGNHLKQYIWGSDVQYAMEDFMVWYKRAEDKLPPVELAARSYQRIISIHPFLDGNGRTARLVMDWILVSKGFPPAAMLGDEIDVAIFGKISNNISTYDLIDRVTRSMERTIRIWIGAI